MKGFTLIEVIIAAVIVFLAVGFAASAISIATDRVARGRAFVHQMERLDRDLLACLRGDGRRDEKTVDILLHKKEEHLSYRAQLQFFIPASYDNSSAVILGIKGIRRRD